MNPNERNILTVTCFGHFMSHFNMLVFPALVIPLMARFHLELGAVLALSFWMYLLFGITALPWGLASDAFGAKPLLFLFYAGSGICALLAAGFMKQPGTFSLCLAGMGLFSGIYHPAGLGMISKGISRMSMALGYNGMAGNAGLAVAPLLTGMINHLFGTPQVYVMVGIFNLAGAVLMLLLRVRESSVSRTSADPNASSRKKTLIQGFLVLCLCMMLGGVIYRGVTLVLPSYFELRNQALFETLHRLRWLFATQNVAATALTSLVFLIGIGGQYIGGRVAERFEPRSAYLLFHALVFPMALATAYATGISLVLVAMLYMLFLLGMQPIENTLVARLTPPRLRHSAYGTKFILTFGVGAFGVQLVRKIQQIWSLPAVFIAMAGVSLGIVLSILLLIRVTRAVPLVPDARQKEAER